MGAQAYRARALLTALVLLLCSLGAVTATASPQSSRLDAIEQQLKDVQKKKAAATAESRELRSQVNRIDSEMGEIDDRIGRLRDDEQKLSSQRTATQHRLEAVRAALARRTEELEVLQAKLGLQREMLGERATSLYKNEQTDSLAILTSFLTRSNGLDELLARFNLLSFVMQGDVRLVGELEQTESAAAQKKLSVDAERNRIERIYQELRAQAESIAAMKGAEEAERNRAAVKVEEKKALLQGVEKDRKSYEAQERELEAESSRIESYLASLSSSGPSQVHGTMRWPVGGRISSQYGWRTHPFTGVRSFHSGIDIAAGYGTTIRAAAAGKVIFTGSRGGYGSTTIIDHGGGIMTLYAHQSSFIAGSGSRVSAGQAIGRVGSTGMSTGSHLHFEVRVKGSTRNPMGYL